MIDKDGDWVGGKAFTGDKVAGRIIDGDKIVINNHHVQGKMNKTIVVKKAEGIGDEQTPAVTISISEDFPAIDYGNVDIDETDRIFLDDAQKIADALDALPGGTLDRLIGLLMLKKASSFIVPLWSSPISVNVSSVSNKT